MAFERVFPGGSKTLFLATTNPGKLTEILKLYAGLDIEFKSPKDFPGLTAPEETGETFKENAALKAGYYFEKTGLPSLADDGGLMVDTLGGLPGVMSHRWLGFDANERELADAVIERLRGVPREKRTAKLGGAVAFWDGDHLLMSENFVSGYIVDELPAEIEPGFPYRSLLVVDRFGKLYKDITKEEDEEINHRRKNLEALRPKILELLGQWVIYNRKAR